MLIGDLEPDQGRVKRRKELEFSYFDQKRSDLDPEHSLRKILSPSGGDYIDVMGKQRHVCGYLKDFMFDPSRAHDRVSQLSGGQKNRLMLAKILANPKSCLILDEPTNDLDMDTLDMLEEILIQYQGTLIVVSHDRDFLDQTVTKILAFEGDGKVQSCVGGYSDYLEKFQPEKGKKVSNKNNKSKNKQENNSAKEKQSIQKTQAPKSLETPKTKMSYKYQRELNQLPDKIEKSQKEIKKFNELLGDSEYYNRDPDEFHETVKNLQEAQKKLERYENRWIELEEMKENSL